MILLGGAPIGQTPLEHRHPAGALPEIRFERAGRETITFTNLEVEAGETRRVFATWSSRTLAMKITSEVGGAEVLVNSRGLRRTARTETFTLEWPDDELLVVLTHPEFGKAYRRLPLSNLKDDELSFSADAFANDSP